MRLGFVILFIGALTESLGLRLELSSRNFLDTLLTDFGGIAFILKSASFFRLLWISLENIDAVCEFLALLSILKLK